MREKINKLYFSLIKNHFFLFYNRIWEGEKIIFDFILNFEYYKNC